jgi:SAM-dependent methyltransferase
MRAVVRADARPSLEALLRCPTCDEAIVLGADEARCSSGSHSFPVVEGIPVFVDEEALAAEPQYGSQRAYFDSEFAGYAEYRLENWRRSYLDRLREAGALDGPLVDVGVGGSGYTVIEAARAGQTAIGCDLSLEGLLAARRFAASEGVADRTLWVCCSAERLPLASASFASALAIAVLEHVPDDAAALSELARVLEPGGRAWVTVPHALRHAWPVLRPPNRRHDRRLGHLRRYEAEDLVDAASRLGLEAGEVQFTGHPIKVLQLLGSRLGDRFWWWCERRDRRRSQRRAGSMQLSVVFTRAG